MEKITVIGSINMDLVVQVDRFPKPGETLTGARFDTVPGGKGANQAVALARLGSAVRMAGLVGRDAFGDQYLAHFNEREVDTSLVGRGEEPTGVALIEVDASGENRIVVVRGANSETGLDWVEEILPRIADSSVVLMQLEIPMESVLAAARAIAARGGRIVLDPAPMQEMPEELLSLCYILTPNEHELRALTSNLPESASIEERMRDLNRRGAQRVLHKRGAQGAFLCTQDGIEHFAAYRVNAVDTTAAGDSFNAGFAHGIASGLPLPECIRVACAVGALATTRFGAQAGMPTMDEVQALMEVSDSVAR